MAGEDRAKWNSSKVRGARADEVGERGAFRMVNRISRAAATAGEFAGRSLGAASRQLKPSSTGAFPYVLGHSY